MSYIKNSLVPGEKLIKEFTLNKYNFYPSYILISASLLIMVYGILFHGDIDMLLFFVAGITGFISGIISYYFLKTTEYGLTDKRVIAKTGIISRNSEELLHKAIETVEVKQGILGRIFGYGSVIITGRGNAVVIFKDIDKPLEIKKIIDSIIFGEIE